MGTIDYEKDENKSAVGSFAEALAAAPVLRTFRGMTQPDEILEFELERSPATETFLKCAMQSWASQFLDVAPQITALSLCHDAEREHLLRGIPIKPGFHCRGQIVKPYGKTEAIALVMSKEEVREIEPVSEILKVDAKSWQVLRQAHEL